MYLPWTPKSFSSRPSCDEHSPMTGHLQSQGCQVGWKEHCRKPWWSSQQYTIKLWLGLQPPQSYVALALPHNLPFKNPKCCFFSIQHVTMCFSEKLWFLTIQKMEAFRDSPLKWSRHAAPRYHGTRCLRKGLSPCRIWEGLRHKKGPRPRYFLSVGINVSKPSRWKKERTFLENATTK